MHGGHRFRTRRLDKSLSVFSPVLNPVAAAHPLHSPPHTSNLSQFVVGAITVVVAEQSSGARSHCASTMRTPQSLHIDAKRRTWEEEGLTWEAADLVVLRP